MRDQVVNFLREEDGATALEYALIAGLVALAIVVAVTQFGTALSGLFTRLSNAVTGVNVPGGGTGGTGGGTGGGTTPP